METGCSLINDRLTSTSPATPTKKAGALQELQESPATVIDDPISAWDHTESFVGNACTSSSSVKTAIIAELDELISKLDSMTPRPEQKTDAVLTSPSPIMDFPCSAWGTVDVDVTNRFSNQLPLSISPLSLRVAISHSTRSRSTMGHSTSIPTRAQSLRSLSSRSKQTRQHL